MKTDRFQIGAGVLAWVFAAAVAGAQTVAPETAPSATNAPAVTNAHPVAAPGTPVTNAPVAHRPIVETVTPVPVVSETAPPAPGRWQVGTRFISVSLLDTKRGGKVDGEYVGTFMGSIAEIKDQQDLAPTRVFAQGRIVDWPVWAGLSYDHVRAKTEDSGGGDGSVDLRGPIFYVQGRWVNETRWTPFAELGYAFYSSDFKENEWSDGGRRSVSLKDTHGVELAAGVDVTVGANWSVNLYARRMSVEDVKGAFYIDGGYGGPAIYTMSYIGYGLGVSYTF